MAALRTGLPPSEPACPDAGKKPYVVISSVPVALPGLTGEGTIAPHAVYRVIQGYRYFGSYGITNIVGGADGQACELRNVVRGPAGKGDYSFGDVIALKAFAPDEKVAPAKAFDTLDQAAKYVNEGSGLRECAADANVSEDQKLVPPPAPSPPGQQRLFCHYLTPRRYMERTVAARMVFKTVADTKAALAIAVAKNPGYTSFEESLTVTAGGAHGPVPRTGRPSRRPPPLHGVC